MLGMKHKALFLALGLFFVGLIYLGYSKSNMVTVVHRLESQAVIQLHQGQNKHHVVTQETPIEPYIRNASLKTTYYYEYDAEETMAVHQVFDYAIEVYNRTGIVHLVPGSGLPTQNKITFYTYQKKKSNSKTPVELGNGGLDLIRHPHCCTVNHGQASLNIMYSDAITRSAAVHELGHALGLDHSEDAGSVMYPMDQGHVQLSTGDIQALKDIYG